MAETKTRNFKRETATKALFEMIERIKNLNEDDTALLKVLNVCIIGSYVKKTSTVHDLDVFLEFEKTSYLKNLINTQYKGDETKFRIDYAQNSNREFSCFAMEILWFEEEHWRKIKNKSRILSLHSFDELNNIDVPSEEKVHIITNGIIDNGALSLLTED